MAGVATQHVGAHDEQPDRSRSGPRTASCGESVEPRGDPGRQAGVVEADVRVLDRRGRAQAPREVGARPRRVAADQQPHHAGEVLVRAGEPELHGEEVGAHVLGGAGHELQDLRQAAQHRHLLRAGVGVAGGTALAGLAAQALQEGQHPRAVRAVHGEFADAGEAHDLPGRHEAQHGVAGRPPRHERRHHCLDMRLQEHHVDEDDVAGADVGDAAPKRGRVAVPVGRGVEGHRQAGDLGAELPLGGGDRLGDVAVEREDDDADGDHLSGPRNALWRHTAFPA